MPTGSYGADRAAAISGVPKPTMYRWARQDIVPPTVSREKEMRWSYEDLAALRIVYWLRQPKTVTDTEIRGTTLRAIRKAISALRALKQPIWDRNGGERIIVTRAGELHYLADGAPVTLNGQHAIGDMLDVLSAFSVDARTRGPDLERPRPLLLIRPTKLGGAPHVEGTRVATETLATLRRDGFTEEQLLAFYPFLTREQVDESLDLERQLAENIGLAAA